jgi:hypothetical protein
MMIIFSADMTLCSVTFQHETLLFYITTGVVHSVCTFVERPPEPASPRRCSDYQSGQLTMLSRSGCGFLQVLDIETNVKSGNLRISSRRTVFVRCGSVLRWAG